MRVGWVGVGSAVFACAFWRVRPSTDFSGLLNNVESLLLWLLCRLPELWYILDLVSWIFRIQCSNVYFKVSHPASVQGGPSSVQMSSMALVLSNGISVFAHPTAILVFIGQFCLTLELDCPQTIY